MNFQLWHLTLVMVTLVSRMEKKDLLLCHSISLNLIMRRRGAAGGERIYNLKLTHHSGRKWNKMKEQQQLEQRATILLSWNGKCKSLSLHRVCKNSPYVLTSRPSKQRTTVTAYKSEKNPHKKRMNSHTPAHKKKDDN